MVTLAMGCMSLHTGLIRAVGLPSANVPEASVTEGISEDLRRQEVWLKELHIDRAYLSSHWVRQRSADLEVYCKARPVRQGKHLPKQAFTRDLGTATHPVPGWAADAFCSWRSRPLPQRDLPRVPLERAMHQQCQGPQRQHPS
jgi:hypothetical protein